MASQTMTAIEISAPGAPDVLKPVEVNIPEPGAGQILIRVHAAGVNRPDVAQRQGSYPPPPGASPLPGLEIAGDVVAKDDAVSDFNIGDKVCALLPGGGYAQYAVVDARNALPMPTSLSYIEAAAVPETFFTVWHNVFQRGQLKSGETLLVHGGSSGIGTTAIQLAKAFGAKVIVTAGTAEKCAACEKLGADLAINYREQSFVEAVNDFTHKQGVNVILDMIGGDYVNDNYKIAAEDGRIVQIAFLKGHKADINLNLLMRKRLNHTGSTLRPRDVAFKQIIASELYQQVWPLLEKRQVVPLIDTCFKLQDAAKAHQRMEQSTHIGKIVLEVD